MSRHLSRSIHRHAIVQGMIQERKGRTTGEEGDAGESETPTWTSRPLCETMYPYMQGFQIQVPRGGTADQERPAM